jgi:3-phenylpropionate/cinnamic acid dioxygenase small subunit
MRPDISDPTTTRPLEPVLYREVEAFLYMEARLADESRYSEWEALVDDDMFYWVPRGPENDDPDKNISITADTRARLANRIKQLNTGLRFAQVPPSPMRRLLSNIEVAGIGPDEFQVCCNFVLYEMRVQSTNDVQVWPGRIEYKLRRKDGALKMFFKKVMLINSEGAIPALAFII